MGDEPWTPPPAHNTTPGQALREWMRAHNVSQVALARAAGCTPKHISQLTRDKQTYSIGFTRALAIATGVPASYWTSLLPNSPATHKSSAQQGAR